MAFIGGNGYVVQDCPACGELMWNGRCENLDCDYHWFPLEDENEEES